MSIPSKARLTYCLSALALSPLSLLAQSMELGSVDVAVTDSWVLIDLENTYTTPIVAIGSITRNDSDSLVAQVRNVTSAGFEVRVVDWGTAGLHTGVETISFIAMEEGRHDVGGVTFEAGKKDDFGALPFAQDKQTGYLSVSFDPIVKQANAEGDWNFSAFTQIVGDVDPSAIHCRHDIDASSTDLLTFRFEQALDDSSAVTVSELHYIVVQAGQGVTSGGVPFKSLSTARLYEDAPKDLEFGGSFPDPLVFGRMPYIYGGDSTALRVADISDTKLTVYADEATGWNKIHTTESVAMLVVGSPPEPLNIGEFGEVITDSLTSESINSGSIHTGDLDVTGSLTLNDGSGSPFTVDADDLKALSLRKFDTLAIGENAVISGDTKLAVDGDVDISGSLQVDGDTVLTGDVTLEQVQGDVSMGEFGE